MVKRILSHQTKYRFNHDDPWVPPRPMGQLLERKKMIRICPTCEKEFEITKFQKQKVYCSGPCSKGYYNTSNKKRKKK